MRKCFHYIISIRKSMKITALMLLLAVTYAQLCAKGGLKCDQGSCHYPLYLEGCLNYAADNSCAICEYNYQLTNGKCLYSPNLQGSDCCAQFNTSGACVSCAKGLYINSASGLCEDKKIEGCLLKNNGACSVCAFDYDLIGSICVKSVIGCTAYDQYYNCISCNSSYVLANAVCVPVITTPTITNCKYLNEYGCVECIQGWRVASDGSCTPATVGCLIVNSDGSCQTCQSPYFQLQNGQCSIVGCLQLNGTSCTQCNSLLGFALSNGVCSIPNCIYFTANGCSVCQGGLLAGSWGCKNSTEKVCLICKINEYLGNDGQCHAKNVHCTKYQNGKCVSCCDAYYLDSNSICQQQLVGCVYSNGVCSSCIAPFTFSNGVCSIGGCLTYSAKGCTSCDSRLTLSNFICTIPFCQQIQGFTCVSCIANYQLTSQGCVPVDPNCAVKNSFNVCLKCKQGYQLGNNGICIALKVGCNYVDGICTSCRAPFLYVAETKSCVIDGCLSYFVGGCSQCATSYTLLYNSCKLPNCLTSSNGKCLQCDPDYVFTSLGLCVSKDQFCDKMNEYGTCIKCLSNYYYSLTDKKCIKQAPGCNYDNDGVCCSCNAPFTFSNGQCVILGCETLAERGCVKCTYPFKLNNKATCEIAHCNAYAKGVCIGCSQGYALNANRLCVAQDPNCLNYNIEQTECQTCIKGYRFDENGICEYADANCWQFDSSGICMNCDRIYFLNPYGKCQLRDPQCTVYTNGYCTQCNSYYFVSGGVCMPNLKGCKTQKSYSQCLACDTGYDLKQGTCRVQITQLTWNSIDMDFQDGSDEANTTFTTQFTSTTNLVQSIATGGAKVFFSSSSLTDAQFQVDSQGSSGWSPVGQAQGSFVGVKTTVLQTFYAVDIRVLTGNSLTQFTLQYSMDGKSFTQIGSFSLTGIAVGTVKTFYFSPVYAQYIRIVAQSGTPNIKFEFYYSSTLTTSLNSSDNSYITKTLSQTLDTAFGGESTCQSNTLCWAGVEACEPRQLSGFNILYTNCGENDIIETVTIDYSTDGISFTCWNNCKEQALTDGGFSFPSPLLAQKVHVHFTKYHGNPHFGIKFNWTS